MQKHLFSAIVWALVLGTAGPGSFDGALPTSDVCRATTEAGQPRGTVAGADTLNQITQVETSSGKNQLSLTFQATLHVETSTLDVILRATGPALRNGLALKFAPGHRPSTVTVVRSSPGGMHERGGDWSVPECPRETLTISYVVQLAAPAHPGGGILFRPGDVFPVPVATHISALRTNFRLPEDWSVIVGWPSQDAPTTVKHGNTLDIAASTQVYERTLLYIGNPEMTRFSVDGRPLFLAVNPVIAPGSRAIIGGLPPLLKQVIRSFGFAAAQPVQMVLDVGPGAPRGRTRSRLALVDCRPDWISCLSSEASIVITHEYVHLLTPTPWTQPSSAWFAEGLAQLVALQVHASVGRLTDSEFNTELGIVLSQYDANPLTRSLSLEQAGDSAAHGNAVADRLVHCGGMLIVTYIALALDESGADLTSFLAMLDQASSRRPFRKALADCLVRTVGVERARDIIESIREPGRFDPTSSFGIYNVKAEKPEFGDELECGAELTGNAIRSFVNGAPSYVAGLRIGDEVTSVNNFPIARQRELWSAWRLPVRDSVTVTFVREGQLVAMRRAMSHVACYRVSGAESLCREH